MKKNLTFQISIKSIIILLNKLNYNNLIQKSFNNNFPTLKF
jgi:hypothetical protein